MGVSMTRFGPNSSSMPLEALYAPLYSATSSPIKYTDSSRRISSLIASAIASLNCIVLIIVFFISILESKSKNLKTIKDFFWSFLWVVCVKFDFTLSEIDVTSHFKK